MVKENSKKNKHLTSCHYVRYYYRANTAQSEYKCLLSEARKGIPLNKQEFYETDRIITEGLKRGQARVSSKM